MWRWTRLCSDAGATLVEFAVSASLVFIVLFGIIQSCLALYTYNYVSDAARVATRYASVRGQRCSGMPDCGIDNSGIQTLLRGLKYPGIDPNNLATTTTWFSASANPPTTWTSCGAAQCNAPQNAVQVTVTYAFPLHIPYWNNATVSIGSTSQEVISN
jgi:Flp pilus assembly protein TadG